MTPRQARTAFGSFLLLAAGVTFNALFLQAKPATMSQAVVAGASGRAAADRARKGPEPQQAWRAPGRAAAKPGEERSVRIARFKPDAAKAIAMPAGPEDETDAETIRAVQRELKQRSYGPIPVDGVMQPQTRAAIMAYEHDQGLVLTGEASEALLRRLLLGASPADLAGGTADSPRAESIVRSVQQALAALGYQPLRSDGRLGEETVRAIREFEMDQGLVPKGRISAELMSRLAQAAAAPKAVAGR